MTAALPHRAQPSAHGVDASTSRRTSASPCWVIRSLAACPRMAAMIVATLPWRWANRSRLVLSATVALLRAANARSTMAVSSSSSSSSSSSC
eukprot:CAMPEP_0185822938 /NCGR_PEP_ID=MMETSP1322-20130828/27422_1 /TAXON_ID=265543 /ORGANISM="Minutocellus polymorphus, Strain RCC2270" /LENGTH=91 /DNA_ID=CAMNT_0028520445 /DNA_START=12 /DNA_END=284 /DNA_ORIENTATION=-